MYILHVGDFDKDGFFRIRGEIKNIIEGSGSIGEELENVTSVSCNQSGFSGNACYLCKPLIVIVDL